MFLVRRSLRLCSLYRAVGDEFENAFKAYLHQAEEIEKQAKEKTKIELNESAIAAAAARTSIKQASLDQVDILILSTDTKPKLMIATTAEQMQVVVEELLLETNLQYKKQKDTQEKCITPGEVIEKLSKIWVTIPEIRIKEVPIWAVLRSIWSYPHTKSTTDFGSFPRITKPGEQVHSAFFYGPLTDSIYINLVKNVGSERFGIKIIRRVLDHMAFHNHKPSDTLMGSIIEECINGKWPRALNAAIGYIQKKEVPLTQNVWIDCINFFRFTKENFNEGPKIMDIALKHGAVPDWELISTYVNKYNRHMMSSESAILINRMRQSIGTYYKKSPDRLSKLCEFSNKFLKTLKEMKDFSQANDYLTKFLAEEKFHEDAVDVALKFYEGVGDGHKASQFMRSLVKNEGFLYTQKIVVGALRMVSAMGKSGLSVVNMIKEKILQEKELSSPFALNMILVSYGYAEDWEAILEFLSTAHSLGLRFNRYTAPTLHKLTEKCLDPHRKGKILDAANKLEIESASNA